MNSDSFRPSTIEGDGLGSGTPGSQRSPSPSHTCCYSPTTEKEITQSLLESQSNLQTGFYKLVSMEEAYVKDLNVVETMFISPLIQSHGVIPPDNLHDFVSVVFSNILDLRECSKRVLETLYVRQQEQSLASQKVGDMVLEAADEFRLIYPNYIRGHPAAERRLVEEINSNINFRLWLETQARNSGSGCTSDAYHTFYLKRLLNRPLEYLQQYPLLLTAIHSEMECATQDGDHLFTAIQAIGSLNGVAQIEMFQTAMGRGTAGKWEWIDLAGPEIREKMAKGEIKRQGIIFELIKTEMAYVKDLENIGIMYIEPLLQADPPIIPQPRLSQFIALVFDNFADLCLHHFCLLDRLHRIQREQHPLIRSVGAVMLDAVSQFREAYMKYIPNYPMAAWKIGNEMRNNLDFKRFVDRCTSHPNARNLDMENFIKCPLSSLTRYTRLLKSIQEETSPESRDRVEMSIAITLLSDLRKDTDIAMISAARKVELWKYNESLMFKPGECVDLDLLDGNRDLIFAGKLTRQLEGELALIGWIELRTLLFDNYLVMTKPKDVNGVIKYQVHRRPIPVDLLTLISFSDPPTRRSSNANQSSPSGSHIFSPGLFSISTTPPSSPADSYLIYPFTIYHAGRAGGTHIFFADSAAARTEWKQKLEQALMLRRVAQESSKIFEIEVISDGTFLSPSMLRGVGGGSRVELEQHASYEGGYIGRVTCSVPFSTMDGRSFVAIGCADGVWIGREHEPKSMRKVLHLKMVTQCATLDEFGVLLILADGSLFAFSIEALVPSTSHTFPATQVPQQLSGTKDVHFFSVGSLHGRTLVIYKTKKGSGSNFSVLEPVRENINETQSHPQVPGLGRKLRFGSVKSDWFKIYRDFVLPSESFDLIFLKAKIAILCSQGFEILDLYDLTSATIPQREDPQLASISKRCDQCKPIAMYRCADDEFLLCYDEFGVYVDQHGYPSRATCGYRVIEWEGRAERAAKHSSFILLFDTHFIEIRSLKTGKLVQIIPGTEVRCTWDGRGISSRSVENLQFGPHGVDLKEHQNYRVHAVMNAPESHDISWRSSQVAKQLVYTLTPTIPLVFGNRRREADGESRWSMIAHFPFEEVRCTEKRDVRVRHSGFLHSF
ncbi:CNH domain-containing protein [Flagelloscypha sp. PMI_526]|nr:CNH domain-containing protein [Flagelloscypha sp. PMI_526]